MDAEVPRVPGGGGGDDPADPGAFAVGYRPHTGDLMVYGGGFLTLVGVLATVVNAAPGFLLASVAGSLSALYFHPTLDLQTPQLAANQEGVFVSHIGMIPWERVKRINVERRALRTMHLSTLVIETDGPLNEALSPPDRLSLAKRLTARNARVRGNVVRASLHTLAVPPDAIERRLRSLYSASRA